MRKPFPELEGQAIERVVFEQDVFGNTTFRLHLVNGHTFVIEVVARNYEKIIDKAFMVN